MGNCKGEHPWIGYTDALGHIFNEEKGKYLPNISQC